MASLIRRRLLSTSAEAGRKSAVKEVTKANFSAALEEFKADLAGSDYVAVSLQKTGSFSAGWHRALPFDTNDTAYLKAKYAAERFQVLQFAACPFSLKASKLTAHPYNFVLFPRDELKMGMPSYSFSVQTSHMTSMAQEGFDFNACVYDGISYLSKAQESAVKARIGNPSPSNYVVDYSVTHTVADRTFIQRIKPRVMHWKNAWKNSGSRKDDALFSSLRKLVMGTELYGSRPCMDIDACSEHQVQLVPEMLKEFSDELVPVIIPAKGGGTKSVRVVLTSSKEDKDLFERELLNVEEEQNKKVHGFREVIDLISASQKPVVSHNSLYDLTFIHSKFLSPLPANIDEFTGSLNLAFPHLLDVNRLMKNVGPLRKVTNIPAAISYLNNHYFAPIDLETLPQENEGNNHRHNVVKICYLFAKLCTILKIPENAKPFNNNLLSPSLEEYTNRSTLSDIPQESINEDVQVWRSNMTKISCDHLVFLWGFRRGLTAGMLKSMLQKSHDVFSEDFDVRLVDKSCAIVVFRPPGLSETFLDVVSNKDVSGSLREMLSEGLKATSYRTYKRACKLGLWEAELADSLDKALEDPDYTVEVESTTNRREILWNLVAHHPNKVVRRLSVMKTNHENEVHNAAGIQIPEEFVGEDTSVCLM